MVLLEAEASVMVSLFLMTAVTILAPLLAKLTKGTIPSVVLLLGLGLLIGPYGTNIAQLDGTEMITQVGMGLLFLLAGMEIDWKSLGGRTGGFAWGTWLVGLLFAMGFAFLLIRDATFSSILALALALTSTALGTLLPILKDRGLLQTKLGKAVLTNGAVGELGPVLVMALLLTTHSPVLAALLILVFLLVSILTAVIPGRMLARLRLTGYHPKDTGPSINMQRGVMVLLTGLMALAAVLEFDVVLGAFAAGIIIKRLTADHAEVMLHNMETMANGFFVPMFFVASGMAIQIDAVLDAPLVMVGFVVIIAIARGLPVYLTERFIDTGSGLTTQTERAQLALYSATGLPIIVAVTQVAVTAEIMPERVAASLVCAGAVTVLVFPLIANAIGPKPATRTLENEVVA